MKEKLKIKQAAAHWSGWWALGWAEMGGRS